MKYFLFVLILLCSCKTYQNVTYNVGVPQPVAVPLVPGPDYQVPQSDFHTLGQSWTNTDAVEIIKSLPPVIQNTGRKSTIVVASDSSLVNTGNKSPTVNVPGDNNVLDDVGQMKPIEKTRNIENDQTWMIWGIAIVVAALLIFALIKFKK